MRLDEIRGLSVEKCTVPFGGKFSFVFPTNGKRSSRSILFMAKIVLFHLAEILTGFSVQMESAPSFEPPTL